jgi:hypothetical protein
MCIDFIEGIQLGNYSRPLSNTIKEEIAYIDAISLTANEQQATTLIEVIKRVKTGLFDM